ncbi:hypothetical protein F0322_20480 [Citrobacter portucalensis]|nr:hypothetical protein F0322_20480 [Citrobacter portucalensis]
MRRRTHLQTAAPTRILQTGGSRINFAAPASEKLSPTIAVYLGGLPRTPSQLSLRPKAGSVARPPDLKTFSHFFAWPERTKEKIGEKRRLKGGGRA